MTSSNAKKIITIHILPNISRSKSNQTIKFAQLGEYNMRKYFFKSHADNEAGRVVPDLVLFFKKTLHVKARGQHLNFNTFW